jgi:hypothetical protein
MPTPENAAEIADYLERAAERFDESHPIGRSARRLLLEFARTQRPSQPGAPALAVWADLLPGDLCLDPSWSWSPEEDEVARHLPRLALRLEGAVRWLSSGGGCFGSSSLAEDGRPLRSTGPRVIVIAREVADDPAVAAAAFLAAPAEQLAALFREISGAD